MQITDSVFATRAEIRDWLAHQAGRFDLHLALVRYRPEFKVVPLAEWQEFDRHEGAEQWREVWIDLRPLRYRCKGQMECCAQKRDRLALQLPDTQPEGLRAGRLGMLSDTCAGARQSVFWRPRDTPGPPQVNLSVRQGRA